MKSAIRGLSVLIVGAAAACGADLRTHGYMPVPEALERIQVGVDSRSTVQRKIGRPGMQGVFDRSGWYYVSTQVEHYMFYEPEVIERSVLAIQFDEIDQVSAVNLYGMEEGRVIDLETRVTPTHGRQLTIIEQLLGNLGAIGSSDFLGDN